jgi:hypothetical protein
MKAQVITSIVNGKFKRNLNTVLSIVKEFEAMDVLLTFEKPKKKRSNNQNSYYWGLLIPITQNAIKDSWGEIWTKEKVHDFYKLHFNFVEKVNEETGEVIKIQKSTTENTTSQQEEYHAQIRQFLKEWFNVDAPLPNEDITLNFE